MLNGIVRYQYYDELVRECESADSQPQTPSKKMEIDVRPCWMWSKREENALRHADTDFR